MLCPWTTSFFQKLCPAPFPPVTFEAARVTGNLGINIGKEGAINWEPKLCVKPLIWLSFELGMKRVRLLRTQVHAKSLQLCLTLWNPMNCSPPGSSVPEILHTRILEWVATPSSRWSSWLREQTHSSYGSCIGRQNFYHYCCLGSPLESKGKWQLEG